MSESAGKRGWWIAVAVLAFSLVAFFVLRPVAEPPGADDAFSPPDQIRPWAEERWKADMAGLLQANPTATPLPVVHVEPGESFQAGDVTLRLANIAVCHTVGSTSNARPDERKTIPPKLFDAKLELVSEGDYKIRPWEVHAGYLSMHSLWQIEGLRDERHRPVKSLGARVYDARTHVLLGEDTHGSAGSIMKNAFKLSCWHQTPVRLVEDIVFGEPQVIDLPLDPDPSFDAQRTFQVGQFTYTLSSFGNKAGSGGFSGQQRFWCEIDLDPAASGRALVKFTAIDPAGNSNRYDSFSPGDNRSTKVTLGFKSGDYQTLRVNVLPSATRLITDLNEIPGLPEKNRGLTDLFDVHLPFDHPPLERIETDRMIGMWTQLRYVRPSVGFSGANHEAGHFSTPRELLSNSIEEGFQYQVDPVAHEIEFSKPNPKMPFFKRLRRIF